MLDKLRHIGYDAETTLEKLENSIRATKRNDGTVTNEVRFWQALDAELGGVPDDLREAVLSFYSDDFSLVLEGSCTAYPRANEVLECVRGKGLRLVLATNPLFPAVATHQRIRLGGMKPEDFEYITAYENSSYCKPSPEYFRELLTKLGVAPEECVMIGNDTKDDFAAHALGIPVFILTDGLINQGGVDLSDYPHGGFDDLISYIRSI
jgi:FMN phosphatase YigB (HAD superfamily)